MASAKKKEERKCGFCGELGHDKRTCVDKKNKDASTKAFLKKGREDLQLHFVKLGLGVGAVVNRRAVVVNEDQTASFQDIMMIVTEVNLETLLVNDDVDVISYARLDDLSSTTESDFGPHAEYNVHGTELKVVKKTSTKLINAMFDKAFKS